jgi:LmbE family N-acetylglucosaminyl deacetylase
MQIPDIDAIDRRYDYVVISPHFDDAVASCGGCIADWITKGKNVLVATVFSWGPGEKLFKKSAFAKPPDYDRRRAEDKAAMGLLGVDFIWLGYGEILFRENIPLFRYWPCYRKTPSNEALSQALASDVLAICKRTGCYQLMLPMAVGQHMDHQLVFQAGIRFLREKVHPCPIIFYEDYPYILYPYMLYYRMKITGMLRMMRKNDNEILKPVQASAYRDAIELLSATPSFKMGIRIAKSFYLLPILIFGLYTRHLMKTYRSNLGKGWIFSHKTYDISHTIDPKLDAVMAYRSQLAHPALKRQRIRNAMKAYSESVGFPKGRFCERYGTITTGQSP